MSCSELREGRILAQKGAPRHTWAALERSRPSEFRRERAPSLRYHRRLPTKGCLMPEPSVRFLGVSKSFGRAEVLRGIDLDVHSGECVGLAGVNGAGKTTLIKCLLDFCDLDSGSIQIHGTPHRCPQSRAQDLLLNLKSEGRPLLFTSHSLADVEEVCDRVSVLHEGTMAYAGAPRGLCERHGEASLERAFLKCIEAHA